MFEVKEKPRQVESALLIGIQRPGMDANEGDQLLDELNDLVETLGIEIRGRRMLTLREPNPHYLIGKGNAIKIIEQVKAEKIELIVFDDDLSPAQQRNWESESGVCVIDRQEVILDIFGQRATTREAKLQVTLAQLNYSLPRLKRAWTHLHRQRGGGTLMRGQGETQLEADRRMVQTRIARVRKDLASVLKQRSIQRKKRLKKPVPTTAIVGYTNAGKSSLLNAITGASVLAEDKLFATLDPTTRQCHLPTGQKLLLSDTVGFLRRLPHDLVDAFRATLEEAVVSDFLIHVLDLTHPEVEKHHETTMEVLTSLGAHEKRIITVFNKVDLCEGNDLRLHSLRLQAPNSCFVSASSGKGIDELLQKCATMIADEVVELDLLVPHDRYDVINKLHEVDCIRDKQTEPDGVHLQCLLPVQLRKEVSEFIVNGESALAI